SEPTGAKLPSDPSELPGIRLPNDSRELPGTTLPTEPGDEPDPRLPPCEPAEDPGFSSEPMRLPRPRLPATDCPRLLEPDPVLAEPEPRLPSELLPRLPASDWPRLPRAPSDPADEPLPEPLP